MERRPLTFRSAQEVLDEIDRLEKSGYQKGKNWSLSQVCDHVAKTLTMGMRGSPTRMPWILRKTIGPLMIGWIIKRGQLPTMTLSAPKPLVPKPPKSSEDDPAKIDWCRSVIREAESFAGPLPPYPLCDDISLDDWRMLNWIHAAHHLGFLIPRQ